jgi:hypothetical protein
VSVSCAKNVCCNSIGKRNTFFSIKFKLLLLFVGNLLFIGISSYLLHLLNLCATLSNCICR